MRIVVLDGHTLNPGDLSWEELERLGDLTVHPRTSVDQVVHRASGAEVVLTNKTPLSGDALRALPGLRYVGVLATGTNVVDLEAAREVGVAVTNIPAYSTPSVAQQTFALLLELTNRTGAHSQSVATGGWSSHEDFSYTLGPLVELSGKTMGIIGFGEIGRSVAAIARTFGMEVQVAKSLRPGAADQEGRVPLPDLLAGSDVVSLHCPLTRETERIVDAAFLGMTRRSAFLLNTSRGGLVDEEALAEALNSGRIAGAGLDVLSSEPPSADNPLLTARNCVITPHFAWASGAARRRLMETAAKNLSAFLAGQPLNVVN